VALVAHEMPVNAARIGLKVTMTDLTFHGPRLLEVRRGAADEAFVGFEGGTYVRLPF